MVPPVNNTPPMAPPIFLSFYTKITPRPDVKKHTVQAGFLPRQIKRRPPLPARPNAAGNAARWRNGRRTRRIKADKALKNNPARRRKREKRFGTAVHALPRPAPHAAAPPQQALRLHPAAAAAFPRYTKATASNAALPAQLQPLPRLQTISRPHSARSAARRHGASSSNALYKAVPNYYH